MRHLREYKVTPKYRKGDFLLVENTTILEEKDFYKLKGTGIEGINSDIKGIDTFEDNNPLIVEVEKIQWVDSETFQYETEELFTGLHGTISEDGVIEKLTDERLLEEINSMEERIAEWIRLHHAKKEGEKYNL